MKLSDFREKWMSLREKKDLVGKKALEAVKQNGYALRYVKEQSESICFEAVKQDGFALRYVSSKFFTDYSTRLERIAKIEAELAELKKEIES